MAVWKFASCDGCQLTLLDCEDELLTLAEEVQIATFLEASSAIVGGPYDVSLVEGSITTAADERRIKEIREQSNILVTIGACATAGGVQALRNFADVDEFASVVYAKPEYIDTLATSTPASATSKSTTSCRAAPSTAVSCSTRSPPCWSDANRACRPRRCAPNARTAG